MSQTTEWTQEAAKVGTSKELPAGEDVDWQQIFDDHADGGELDYVERTEALMAEVDGVTGDSDAELLVYDALDAGVLERDGLIISLADTHARADNTDEDDDRLAALERRMDSLEDELAEERDRRQRAERSLAEVHRILLKETPRTGDITLLGAQIADGLSDMDVDYRGGMADFKKYYTQVGDDFKEMKDAVARHDSVIEEHGQPTGNSKSSAWQDALESARNLQNKSRNGLPGNRVKLFSDNIEQATGYSNRRACQLIDEWSKEKNGTEKQDYKRITTSRKTKGASIQQKALIVDLDVWGDDR